MTGIELIMQERARQVSEEGWTAEHDDNHHQGELARAAAWYALYQSNDGLTAVAHKLFGSPSYGWPWDMDWWKPTADPVRNLVKAGALIAAEIDRLQRVRG